MERKRASMKARGARGRRRRDHRIESRRRFGAASFRCRPVAARFLLPPMRAPRRSHDRLLPIGTHLEALVGLEGAVLAARIHRRNERPTAAPLLPARTGKRKPRPLKTFLFSLHLSTNSPTTKKQSRDIHLESFTLLFHGHELLADAKLELNYGR